MRMLISLVGLLLVLGVVMWLARGASETRPAPSMGESGPGVASPQRIQQQYKEALEDAMKQARPLVDEP